MNNIYELQNMANYICYYATAGFLIKATWLKAIQEGIYATWPMLTTTAIMKCFPELDETQKRHIQQNKQGVQSNKEPNEA